MAVPLVSVSARWVEKSTGALTTWARQFLATTVHLTDSPVTAGHVPIFSDTTGKVLEDGVDADVAFASVTVGAVTTIVALLAPVAFASLTSPVTGMVAVVSNSTTQTWGATIAGGGAFTVLAFYNGAHWTVVGK